MFAYRLSWRRRREFGGIGLVAIILLPTLLLVFNTVLQGSQQRVAEIDYLRACRSQLEIAKASYDRKLWREYGLWGVREGDIPRDIGTELVAEAGSAVILNASRPLWEPEELNRQIQKHMDLRAEALLTLEILDRYQHFPRGGELSSLVSANLAEIDTSDPSKLLSDPPTPEVWPTKTDDTGEEVPIKTEDIDYGKALSPVSGLLEECYSSLLPVYDMAEITPSSNPLEPAGILAITGVVDDLLDSRGFVPEKLALQEYLLNYFTSAVEDQANQGQITPDGRKHSDLIKQGRRSEVEQVICGIFDPDKAAGRIHNYLRMICFTSHLAQILISQAQRSKYMTIAIGISAGVAAATLGTVIIPPSALQYLLIVVNALRLGWSSAKSLVQGKSFTLTLGSKSVDLYYRDFLRMFLLIKQKSTILANLPEVINQVIPGEFCTAFTVNGQIQGKSVVMNSNFGE